MSPMAAVGESIAAELGVCGASGGNREREGEYSLAIAVTAGAVPAAAGGNPRFPRFKRSIATKSRGGGSLFRRGVRTAAAGGDDGGAAAS